MSVTLFPVILAGGSDTRLWPLSRKNYPKQFLRLQTDASLLQQTVARVLTLPHQAITIVSNEAHYFLCQEQLQSIDANMSYLLEPCVRNTAPAIAAAAFSIAKTAGRQAVMLILPSDHFLGDEQAWLDAMQQGAHYAALNPALVTFGIKPSGPRTGYGYIEAGQPLDDMVLSVQSFREKPDLDTAQSFLDRGNFYWNSGMFVCQAGTYLDELEQFAPDIFDCSKQAFEQARAGHDYVRLDKDLFAACRSESIDYAVMEKTHMAAVIPVDMQWSDLGCWTSVAESNAVDSNGNTLLGNVIAKDSSDCLIRSEGALVTALGVRDQIIVVTADAVLVADKRYSQQVKELVGTLGQHQSHLADEHLRVHRPWGYYEILAENTTFKVKRLMVKPGAKLSLQMHQHRAEHWVVVEGRADVVNGEHFMQLTSNQSTYIPQQTRHRLSNSGNEPLYVIEVQSGSYLGEDDIVRFDDVYERA